MTGFIVIVLRLKLELEFSHNLQRVIQHEGSRRNINHEVHETIMFLRLLRRCDGTQRASLPFVARVDSGAEFT